MNLAIRQRSARFRWAHTGTYTCRDLAQTPHLRSRSTTCHPLAVQIFPKSCQYINLSLSVSKHVQNLINVITRAPVLLSPGALHAISIRARCMTTKTKTIACNAANLPNAAAVRQRTSTKKKDYNGYHTFLLAMGLWERSSTKEHNMNSVVREYGRSVEGTCGEFLDPTLRQGGRR